MKIGFTGTQLGMTDAQLDKVVELMDWWWSVAGPHEFHSGDCIGSDAQAFDIARQLRDKTSMQIKLVGHPPDVNAKRAWCEFDVASEPRPYLDRNCDIVDSSDVLIATPGGDAEVLRSGTWATVRYARKVGTPIATVWSNGLLDWEEAT